ncbi:MAG: glycosyltransferase [Solirubrobacteraceae bacterium]
MRVLIVAEYYPRAADPTSGIWSHRQALAARAAGADVRVLVLHRPLPSLAQLRRPRPGALLRRALEQPAQSTIDGITVDYLRYISPPRPWSYSTWGAWAAPPLRRALKRGFDFDLVHAHYAVPAGDSVRRAAPKAPLVVSVHGGDVHGTHEGSRAVHDTLRHARLVLANSAGTARRCEQRGARRARVLHLGTDLPERIRPEPSTPLLVSVGHLIERKRHADVIEALALLKDRHPGLRLEIVGDGPQQAALAELARAKGVAGRVTLRGRLAPERAIAVAREATLFVMPSVAEAFGVAYVEAMAAGVPAIGCRGEDGPEEIAAAGGGIELVPAREPRALADTIGRLLEDPQRLKALGATARATVAEHFTWARCGRETVAAYEEALSSG